MRFVPRALQLLTAHAVHLLSASLELILHRQGNLQRQWADGLDQEIAPRRGQILATALSELYPRLRHDKHFRLSLNVVPRHLLSAGYGRVQVEEQPAVRKRIGGDVEDSHNERPLSTASDLP